MAKTAAESLLRVLLAVLAITGCAAGADTLSPRQALHQYALALQERRVEDAYALLSHEARAGLPFSEFAQMVQENSSEINEISSRLLRPAEPARITTTLTSPDGDTLLLVYQGEGWKVDGSSLDLYSQQSPEEALAAFVRAFENRRYDVLMRFVPDSKKHDLSVEQLKAAWEGEQREQLQRLTQALKASLATLRVELIGTRATVGYGAGATVELVHERGTWKIEDF
jgi:hypothetical protein